MARKGDIIAKVLICIIDIQSEINVFVIFMSGVVIRMTYYVLFSVVLDNN